MTQKGHGTETANIASLAQFAEIRPTGYGLWPLWWPEGVSPINFYPTGRKKNL
jgi:hypothetical protein